MKHAGRCLVSLLLLVLVGLTIEPREIAVALARLPAWSLVPAVLIAIPQVVLSALRWRYTARRLRLALGITESIHSYYRATLVNQLMPGGVLGDVERAWRAKQPGVRASAAAHSIMIERLSGQLALLLTIAVLFLAAPPFPVPLAGGWLWAGAALALLMAGAFRLPGMREYGRLLGADTRAALLRWPAPIVQLGLSLAVVGTYFATLALLDAGISGRTLTPEQVALHACLLLSMVVPVSVAGWGVREGVAAVLWPLAGLPASEGVALGIAYGLVILLGSLPGLIPAPAPRDRPA